MVYLENKYLVIYLCIILCSCNSSSKNSINNIVGEWETQSITTITSDSTFTEYKNDTIKALGFGNMEIRLTVKEAYGFVFYPDSTCLYTIPGFAFKGIWKYNPQKSIVTIFEDNNDEIEEMKLLFNFYDTNKANVKFLPPKNEKSEMFETFNMLNIGIENAEKAE